MNVPPSKEYDTHEVCIPEVGVRKARGGLPPTALRDCAGVDAELWLPICVCVCTEAQMTRRTVTAQVQKHTFFTTLTIVNTCKVGSACCVFTKRTSGYRGVSNLFVPVCMSVCMWCA